ncbi:Protein MAIN-LIKE 1 [Linum grandiflorum]
MPFGEMTITLHDVLHILRIPIKGKPFISRSAPEVHHGMAARILDVTTDEVKKWFLYGGGFHVVNLLKHIGDGKVPTAASEAQIYLFCLLGSTLLPDTTGSCAKIGILESLADVRKIREYAWGAATLAHMYRELGKASRAKSMNFCGCMTLLQSWIYEYFPSLRRVDSPASRDVGAPLVGRWDDVRLGPHSGLDGQQMLYMLRDQLDRLTYTDVQWLPYGIHPFSDDGTWSLYLGGIHAFDYIEPHDPTRVLRQYGYRQTLKVDRIPYKSATRPEDPKHYAVEYVVADDYKKEGLFTAMYIYSTPSILGAEDENVDPGVMEWYLSRTHPYILPASFVDVAGGALSETVSIRF